MSMSGESYSSEQLDGDFLQLEVSDHPHGARVVRATGEIDTLTTPQLRSSLQHQRVGARLLVVDMSRVEFLGSAGLAALVELRTETSNSDQRLRLVCSRTVARALHATGLDELFDVADSVSDALGSV